MRAAFEDLDLSGLSVVHAGARSFWLAPRIRAVSMADLLKEIRPL
jgi:hypothetical protein